MRKAIETRYHGATNFKPARISARTFDNSALWASWDDGLTDTQNHAAIAKAFVQKMGWSGLYVGGALPGSGFAFVRVEGHPQSAIMEGREDADWFFVEERTD